MKPMVVIVDAGMRADHTFMAALQDMGDAVILCGADFGTDDRTVIATRGDDGYFEGIMSGRIPNPLMQLRTEAPTPRPFAPFTRLRGEKAQWKRERGGRQ